MIQGTAINKCRITIMLVLLLIFINATVAGGVYAQQFQLISDSQERELGTETARKIEAQYGVYNNKAWLDKIRSIGLKVAKHSDRPELDYQFRVLNTKMVNAFALPGGFVYVTRGLMDSGISEMELANVLGHEIAHAAKRHSMRQLERNLGIALVLQLATRGKSGAVQLSTQVAHLLLDRGYSREYEFEADNAGAYYTWKAGYNPWGMVLFLERLQKISKGRDGGNVATWFSTHPDTDDRIQRLTRQMQDMKVARPSGPGSAAVRPSVSSSPYGPDSQPKPSPSPTQDSGPGTYGP